MPSERRRNDWTFIESTVQVSGIGRQEATTDAIPPATVEVPAQAPIKRLVARGRYAYVLTGDLRLSIVDLHCEMP